MVLSEKLRNNYLNTQLAKMLNKKVMLQAGEQTKFPFNYEHFFAENQKCFRISAL